MLFVLQFDFWRESYSVLSIIIVQPYVGRTQISRVKILAPWAKGAQNGGEKSDVFVTGTMKLLSL